ncbi:MAG: hypothetical protein HYU66_01945 [Armatimonadetes bacterium]|nr:hypothetical protein [Armatimonadota bacterium]
MDLARLPGVAAVADSEHRDRWGVDGWHAPLAIDGDPQTAWVSDNWEVTHALAVLFPRQVSASALRIAWAGEPPRHFIVEVHRNNAWTALADVRPATPEATSSVPLTAEPFDALRIAQPPDGAVADRQCSIAEVLVEGEPVEPAVPVDTAALGGKVAAEMATLRVAEDAARVKPSLDIAMQRRKTAGFEGIIDRGDLARGRRNIAAHAWAKHWAETVVRDADWWANQSDERLYALIPEGNPRALCPSFELGCPIHGGARQSFTATLESPYHWKCRKGGEDWFDGAVVKNPGTGEDVVVHDDGSGFLAPPGFPHAGRRYYFVAAYRYYLLGKLFSGPYEGDGGSEYQGGTPIVQLSLAYAVTGERKYAHKAAVLLNRLAELYPTWDGCVEGPSQRQDGYIGQTFERFLVQNLTLCCDLIWDEVGKGDELVAFFAGKGSADYDGDGRAAGGDIAYNLQRNLLGYIYEYLHRLMPYMDGDFLMYEMTALASLAHVLQNPAIARETLESDLGLRVLLQNSWFRDGKFIYDSTGYNVGNAQTPLLIAEWLHGLTAPPDYPQPLDLFHDPNYRVSMLYDFLRTVDCDGRPPQIGDCGGSRAPVLRENPAWSVVEERALLRLPEQRDVYTRRFLAASHGNPESYRGGEADWWLVFHAEDPPPADNRPVMDEDPSRPGTTPPRACTSR